MPTARELLEQADALMRRNRGREPEPDIPELTDEVAIGESAPAARRVAAPAPAAAESRREADDVPELTEVARIEEVSIQPPPDEGIDSRWLESELGGASITGPAPDSLAVVPPSTLLPADQGATESVPPARPVWRSDEHKLAPETAAAVLASPLAARGDATPGAGDAAFDAMLGLRPAETDFEQELAPPSPAAEEIAAAAEPEATAEPAPVEEMPEAPIADAEAPTAEESAPAVAPSWDVVAEEIRMQVLQRIDIFTDTGLQGELAARLQPVVDRASADLIATINREVGQLLRAYVAEAIEREIEKWRESNP